MNALHRLASRIMAAALLVNALNLGATPQAASFNGPTSSAAIITVTTTADELNTDGDCSLREAIRAANLNATVDACPAGSGADTIIVPAGAYTLTVAGTSEDVALTGDLDITDALILNGVGQAVTIIDGDMLDRVFHVIGSTTEVTISDLTVQHGQATIIGGGGIYNDGLLTLTNSTVSMNNVGAGDGGGLYSRGTLNANGVSVLNNAAWNGGGIYASGPLTLTNCILSGNTGYSGGGIFHGDSANLTDCVFDHNSATAAGGGIRSSGGPLTLTRAVVISNTVVSGTDWGGGGIEASGSVTLLNSAVVSNTALGNNSNGGGLLSGGTLSVTNSTFSGNAANYKGGGIYHGGPATVLNSTFSNNSAFAGGGLANAFTTATFKNTIVANSPSGGNCTGTLISSGHNLDSGNSCGFTGTGDQVNTNPLLASLQNNGGTTWTHALLPGSPALDAGDNVSCPAADQRGVTRPQNGVCDIGAYEQVVANFSISGQVIDDAAAALPDVTLSLSTGFTQITDANGHYTFTSILTGTYFLTPTLAGFVFSPVTRTVSVPPDVAGQDFSATVPPPPVPVSGVSITGPAYGAVNASHAFTATVSPITATLPITYTWTPVPANGNGAANATYSWTQAGMQTITVTVANVNGSAQVTHTVLVTPPPPALQWALSGLDTYYIDALAVAASDTYTVYAASGNEQLIWKSINGGGSWAEVQFGQPHYALAVSPLNASVAYAGQSYRVLKTVNGGTTWVELPDDIGMSDHTGLAIDPQNPSTVYAAVSYGWGGYKTINGGANWNQVLPDIHATSVAIDPLNLGVVYMGAQDYLGTGGGVYKTINGGAAWTKVLTDAQVNALAIDPLSPNLVYAATEANGVFKSADGGATWGAANAGLTYSVARALAIDPTDPSVVYAGTWEGGVYRSIDNGANWSAVNAGLTNTFIRSLAVDPAHPGVVYAGTEGGGVFKSSPILQTPLTGVTISGPTVGAFNVSQAFTATISPLTATAPISYVWTPAPANGQGTANVTYSWAVTGTQTITVTASNAGGSVMDTHAIAIVDPSTGDAYEPDDACAQASSLTTTGAVQEHTFHKQADSDWASFTVVSGTTYVLLAASTSAEADLNLGLYAACGGSLTGSDGNAFGADASLTFVASADAVYYAKAFNQSPDVFGPQVTYNLSVRALSPVGAVLIVAGHDDTHSLQSNILYATNFAYRTFVNSGVPKTSIRYLSAVSSNALTDADGDGLSDVYAASSAANIQTAITTWAATMTGGSKAFYIYLMDHGGVDVFLNNGSADTLTPDQLDGWLTTLENATGAKVSVIYEACHSGSFVDGVKKISKTGRVIIASTSRENNAYPASLRGALFSDAFFTALGQNDDLYTGFLAGTAAVRATGLAQTPWLDDNGDAAPNAGDGALAQGRGLARFAFAGTRPPVIDLVSPPAAIQAGIGQIQATVRDDAGLNGIQRVWVVVYPPSFVEPPPAPDGTTPDLNLPPVTLSDSNQDGVFVGLYENFNETGLYRVVAYAEDTEGNLSAPVVLQMNVGGGKLYLPLIQR